MYGHDSLSIDQLVQRARAAQRFLWYAGGSGGSPYIPPVVGGSSGATADSSTTRADTTLVRADAA